MTFAPTSLPTLMAWSSRDQAGQTQLVFVEGLHQRLPLHELDAPFAGEHGGQRRGEFAAKLGIGRIVGGEIEDGDGQTGGFRRGGGFPVFAFSFLTGSAAQARAAPARINSRASMPGTKTRFMANLLRDKNTGDWKDRHQLDRSRAATRRQRRYDR